MEVKAREIEASPFNYHEFVEFISKLRSERDTFSPLLRHMRSVFCSIHLPDVKFWTSWIEDEPRMEGVVSICLDMCPHVDVVFDILDAQSLLFEQEELDSAEMRKLFGLAVVSCGLDVLHGGLIYKKYLEFEAEELRDLLEANGEKEAIHTQKNRIVALIHAQLSLPLTNNEKALQEISELMSEIFVEDDVRLVQPETLDRKYKAALELRPARLVFEEQVLSERFDSLSEDLKLASWKTYIQFEIDSNQLLRAQRLYERAVLSIPLSYVLWCEFLDFSAIRLKNWSLVKSVGSRALRVFRNDAKMWKLRLLSLEATRTDSEEIDSMVSSCLMSGLSTPEHYLELGLFSCEFRSRRLISSVLNPVDQEIANDVLVDLIKLSELRASFDKLESNLTNYFNDWSVGLLTVAKYRTDVEGRLAPFVPGNEASRLNVIKDIWEKLVSSQGQHHFIWVPYFEWAITNREAEFCRKLFKRALHHVSDYPLEIGKEWASFERRFGDVNNICSAFYKIETFTNDWNQKHGLISQDSASGQDRNNSNNNKIAGERDKKRKLPTEDVSKGAAVVSSHEIHLQFPHEVNADDGVVRSLQISNLNFSTTENDLRTHVSRFVLEGSIVDVRFVLAKSGRPRGVAVVEFDGEQTADAVLALLNQTELGGRILKVEKGREVEILASKSKCLTSGSEAKTSESSSAAQHPTTVFVSKFPLEYSEYHIRELFSPFGELVAVKLARDKKTGESKGHALVQFQKVEDRKVAMKTLNKKILDDEHTLSVLPSKFPAEMEGAKDETSSQCVKRTAHVEATTTIGSIKNMTSSDSGMMLPPPKRSRIVLGDTKEKFGLGFKPRALR